MKVKKAVSGGGPPDTIVLCSSPGFEGFNTRHVFGYKYGREPEISICVQTRGSYWTVKKENHQYFDNVVRNSTYVQTS